MAQLIQCRLSQKGCRSTSNIVAWLPAKDVILNSQVTLKDGPPGWWRVDQIGNIQLDHSEINRGWDNNI